MRLATALLALLSLLLLAGAAYLAPGRWQVALYLDVLAWTLTLLFLLAVAGEALLGAWARGGVALLAALEAAALSLRFRPGSLEQFPFHEMVQSAERVITLGCAAGALLVGAAAVRAGRRGPALAGAVAMGLALFALRGWIRGLS